MISSKQRLQVPEQKLPKTKDRNKTTPNKDESQVTKNTMLSGTCRKTLDRSVYMNYPKNICKMEKEWLSDLFKNRVLRFQPIGERSQILPGLEAAVFL